MSLTALDPTGEPIEPATDTVAPADDVPPIDMDRPVRLYPLVYLEEDDQVTVGRPDIDSYAILPPDGAALVRQLEAGRTGREAGEWFAQTYGEPVDVAELIAALHELDLVRPDDGTDTGTDRIGTDAPVRWQRLGVALFSPVAAAVYVLIVAAWVAVMARHPALVPGYRHLFFTRYFSVVEVVLFLGQFPLMLVHEAAHALAGRRLGLRSGLRIGHRLYFLVLETSLDGLVSVPRRKRYLPMLAGMGADILTTALLALFAAALRAPDGSIPIAGRIALALGFTTLLRVAWQFYFYLQTDLYFMVSTALGCVQLHRTAGNLLRNRCARLLHRPGWAVDDARAHPNDVRAARWYSWLLLVGYAATLAMAVVAVIPTAYRFLTGVFSRFGGAGGTAGMVDTGVFIGLNLAQVVLVVIVARRARRGRGPAAQHVIE